MTKFNNIKIYLAMVSVIVALLFSGCIEETPKDTNTTTIPSIKQKTEVIEQELKYNNIRGLVEVDGKLAYQVVEGGKNFIVYDGKEIGKRYDFAGYPVEVNGKLAYVAKKGDKEFIVYDGKESNRYDEAGMPIAVNGKLVFIAMNNGKWYIVWWK